MSEEGPFRVRVSPGMTRVCPTLQQAEKMLSYYLNMATPPRVDIIDRSGRVIRSTRSSEEAS